MEEYWDLKKQLLEVMAPVGVRKQYRRLGWDGIRWEERSHCWCIERIWEKTPLVRWNTHKTFHSFSSCDILAAFVKKSCRCVGYQSWSVLVNHRHLQWIKAMTVNIFNWQLSYVTCMKKANPPLGTTVVITLHHNARIACNTLKIVNAGSSGSDDGNDIPAIALQPPFRQVP